jgi:hypothetical protein
MRQNLPPQERASCAEARRALADEVDAARARLRALDSECDHPPPPLPTAPPAPGSAARRARSTRGTVWAAPWRGAPVWPLKGGVRARRCEMLWDAIEAKQAAEAEFEQAAVLV